MPGTGHSHRYKSSISNRNAKPAFQVLAPWNKGKLGKPGQVPVISEGGGNLQFSSHLNLDSVTLSANSLHIGEHTISIDEETGCLSHTMTVVAGEEPLPLCFDHGIKTNSITLEGIGHGHTDDIKVAGIDVTHGISGMNGGTTVKYDFGVAGFIRIPRYLDTDVFVESTAIDANSTLWFWVTNPNFEAHKGGTFLLQFCQPQTTDATPLSFIDPGGITAVWRGVTTNDDPHAVLFGLQNPNSQAISLYTGQDETQPGISWIYFNPAQQ